MKQRLLTLVKVLLAVVVLTCGITVAACTKTEIERPSADLYYSDDGGFENSLTFTDNGKFTLVLKDEKLSGKFILDEDELLLKAGKNVINAVYEDDTISFTYNEKDMVFYEKVSYTVTFETNGGNAIAPVPVLNGRTVAEPSEPTRFDYIFIDWYADSDLKTPFDFNTKIRKNTTIYADWELETLDEEVFTVSFDLLNGNQNPQPLNTRRKKLRSLPAAEWENHTFKGWWVSMTDKAEELSYPATTDTVFLENTTLYALWQSDEASDRLPAPVVTVNETGVSWEAVSGATRYQVQILNPDNTVYFDQPVTNALKKDVKFVDLPAGNYTVSVTANASDAANDSAAALRIYRNKALTRVSWFSVNEETLTLSYNAIENAEKYLITVDCGDVNHTHTMVDNGNKLEYCFKNCMMQPGGIKITVTTRADGYADASRTYVYGADKNLAKVSGFSLDEATMQLSWNAVEHATGYFVTVTCSNADHKHKTVSLGNKTSYSLKEYVNGDIAVGVYATAYGYNASEEAIYTFEKLNLATPTDVRLTDTLLEWSEVAGATGYTVKIGNDEFTVTTNSLDLASAEVTDKISWTETADYKVSVRANGTVASIYSEELDIRGYALSVTLKYSESVLSWNHVYGAKYYEVKVNNETPLKINDGSNYAEILLTQAGDNTVSVRFNDGEKDYDWVDFTVFAYTVNIEDDEGNQDTLYKAVGDKMDDLPVSSQPGYNFGGWYYSRDNGVKYTDDFFAGGDLQLYYIWAPKDVTLTYNYGNSEIGTGDRVDDVVRFGAEYELYVPTPVDTRYIFLGWYSGPNGEGVQYTDYTGKGLEDWGLTYNATVYANWKLVFKFTEVKQDSEVVAYTVGKDSTVGTGAYWLPEKLTVPAFYNDLPVIRVVYEGFTYFNNVKTVNLPDTIEEIGQGAFNRSYELENIYVYHVDGYSSGKIKSEGGLVVIQDKNGNYTLPVFPAGRTEAYSIPEGVQEIPKYAFFYCNLSEITIPKSVTTIASDAFYYCQKLTKIYFEDDDFNDDGVALGGLTIMKGAFYYSSLLDEIRFPARLGDFSIEMFQSSGSGTAIFSKKITKINIQGGNAKYSSVDGYLTTKDKETLVYCPLGRGGDIEIPVGIINIGEGAFKGNENIKNLVIPSGVENIEKSAFSGCKNLESVTFEGGRVAKLEIGQAAFYGCASLTTVTFEEGCNVVSIGTKDYEIQTGEKDTQIGAFAGCTKLESVELPASLKTLGDYTFYNLNSKLTSVKFEKNSKLEVIGNYAFYNCRNMNPFDFGSSLSVIGKYAFYNCDLFMGLNFDPDGAEITLEDNAFDTCDFEEVYLTANVKEVGSGVFNNCTKLNTISVDPDSEYLCTIDGVLFDKAITQLLFYPAGKTDPFTIPDTVKSIGAGLLKNNAALTEVVIGKNVTFIGENAFSGCANLTTVTFDKTLTYENEEGKTQKVEALVIKANAFSGCPRLSSFELPNRIAEISDYMLMNDTSLQTLSIPESVTKIGNYAVYNTGITSLYIGNSVNYIGTYAFANNKSLTTVTFEDGVLPTEDTEENEPATQAEGEETETETETKKLEELVFGTYERTGQSSAAHSGSSTNKFLANTSSAFYDCSVLTNLTLTHRIKTMPSRLFYGCNMTEVEIPNSVTFLGVDVFEKCSKLTTIEFEEGNEKDNELVLEEGISYYVNDDSVYTSVFGNSPKLSTVEFPNRVKRIPVYCFNRNNALTEITLPASLDNKGSTLTDFAIASRAFYYCANLTTVSFDSPTAKEEEGGQAKDGESTTEQHVIISAYAFDQCTSLTQVNLPNTLSDADVLDDDGNVVYHAINYNSFNGSTKLGELNVATGGKYYSSQDGILYNADKTVLYLCPVAKKGTVTIPNTVQLIATLRLTSFTESNSFTTNYYVGAFANCKGITAVDFESGNVYNGTEEVEKEVEKEDGSTETVKVEQPKLNKLLIGTKDATSSSGTFLNLTGLTSISLPERLYYIGPYTFSGCTNLKTISFATDCKLDEIGSYAFQKTSFTTVVIPVNATKLGDNVFASSKLDTITLPANLKDLGNTFGGCTTVNSISVPKNDNFESDKDGIIFKNDAEKGRTLYYYPIGRTAAEYRIPEGVKTIAAGAFQNNEKLVRVIIPQSVITIEADAFNGCKSLKYVIFVEGGTDPLTIEAGASNAAKTSFFTDYVSSSSVTSVYSGAFLNCLALYSVHLPARLRSLGGAAFYNCKALTEVTLEDTSGYTDEQIGKMGLLTINSVTFGNCYRLKKVELPETVVTIGSFAFDKCYALEDINLPDSLRTIRNFAFEYCSSLKSVVIPSKVTNLGDHGQTSTTSYKGYVFRYCGSLESVTLPENLASCKVSSSLTGVAILPNMFEGCMSLTSVSIPANIKIIAGSAFKDCANLTTVTFEKDNQNKTALTHIDTSAFNGCSNLEYAVDTSADTSTTPATVAEGETGEEAKPKLKSFEIPSSVTSIAATAFANSGIKTLSLPSGLNTLTTAFQNCTKLTEIKSFGGVTAIPAQAFINCGFVNLKIPKEIASIDLAAFAGCLYLETLTFEAGGNLGMPAGSSNNVTNAKAGIFEGCTALKTVDLNGRTIYSTKATTNASNANKLGAYTFYGCTALETVIFPDTMKEIGNYAFWGCTSLYSFKMPLNAEEAQTEDSEEDVKLPEDYAKLPDGITTLGTYAFYGCTALKKIDLNAVTSLGGSSFRKSGLTSVVIPQSVTSIGAAAFAECEDLGEVEFEDGSGNITVTTSTSLGYANYTSTLSTGTFYNCTSLKSVKLNRINNIKAYMFFGSGITSIKIPSKVTTIGYAAFSGCKSLQSVEFEEGTGTISLSAPKQGTATYLNEEKYSCMGMFADCTSLTSVKLNRITAIGTYMFYGTGNIQNLEIPATVTDINYMAFKNSGVNKVTFKADKDGNTALNWIGRGYSGDNQYASYCFTGCKNLTTVVFEAKTSTKGINVGDFAFAESGLTSLTLPSCVNAVGYGGFSGCASLETVTVPDTFKSIYAYVFEGCTSLKNLNLSNITSIGNYSFANCASLKSVTIPDTLTSMGTYAFAYSGLTAMPNIPQGTAYINNSVFRGCKDMVSAAIPAHVEIIYGYAFEGCEKLANLTFDNGCKTIQSYVFANCKALGGELVLPSSLETIGNNTFAYTALTKVTVSGSSLASIGLNPFAGSKLAEIALTDTLASYEVSADGRALYAVDGTAKTLLVYAPAATGEFTLPAEATSIAAYAFAGSKLTNIVLHAGVEEVGVGAFMGSNANVTINGGNIGADDYMFNGATGLGDIVLPAGTTAIGDYAFEGSSITSIYIPASVTSIGAYAFANCANLKTVTFESGSALESLGAYAFAGSGITAIVLPDSVTSAGEYLFANCASLASVELGTGITAIGGTATDHIFDGCSKLATVKFPATFTTIGAYAFEGCGIKTLTVPATVTNIAAYAFANMPEVTAITFAEGITALGATSTDIKGTAYYFFAGSDKLATVNLPSTLAIIGNYAFAESAITGITIPASVTFLGFYAFANTKALVNVTFAEGFNSLYALTSAGAQSNVYFFDGSAVKNVTLPSTLETIGNYAFYNSGLTAVTIPASVTYLGKSAFRSCASLETVTLGEGINASFQEYLFADSGLKTFEFPEEIAPLTDGGVPSYGTNLFNGCSSLISVKLAENVAAIPSGMFSGCSSLSDITLPDCVNSLGTNCFANCTSIANIILSNNIATIYESTFDGWTESQTITLKGYSKVLGWFTVTCSNKTEYKPVYMENTLPVKFVCSEEPEFVLSVEPIEPDEGDNADSEGNEGNSDENGGTQTEGGTENA